jgi:lipopolysaccharide/colanic/teichoic acid biosynthesis glycosyltransferase
MVLGEGPAVAVTVRRLTQFPDAGLVPVATGPLSQLQSVDRMLEQLRQDEIEHVVLVPTHGDAALIDGLRPYHLARTSFSLVPPLADLALRPGHVAQVAGIPFLPLGRLPRGPMAFPGKRALDLLVAGFAMVLLLPLFAVLAIKLDDGGPVFYRQRRVGLGGLPFMVLKFRSMVVDADRLRAHLAADNVADGLLFKLEQDPRLTRLGNLLRRTSVDELPQLWNVLRGDMSLVGPRPLPVDPDAFGPTDGQRHGVRPGITGYWQVSGGNGLSYREMVKLDLAYLHNWSLWLDLRLLMQTVPAVFHRSGPI